MQCQQCKLKLVLTTLLAAMGVGLSSPVSAQEGTTTTSTIANALMFLGGLGTSCQLLSILPHSVRQEALGPDGPATGYDQTPAQSSGRSIWATN